MSSPRKRCLECSCGLMEQLTESKWFNYSICCLKLVFHMHISLKGTVSTFNFQLSSILYYSCSDDVVILSPTIVRHRTSYDPTENIWWSTLKNPCNSLYTSYTYMGAIPRLYRHAKWTPCMMYVYTHHTHTWGHSATISSCESRGMAPMITKHIPM